MTQQLRRPDLRCLETDRLLPHDDVENRVRSFDAGTESARFLLIPAPTWVRVRVCAIGAEDMRPTRFPVDPDPVEDLSLAPFRCGLDRNRLHEAGGISHHAGPTLIDVMFSWMPPIWR